MHNVQHLLSLMGRVRNAIIEGRYPQFLREFFGCLYGGEKSRFPAWAIEALRNVGVNLIEETE